jgi:hypothetical protein
VAHSTVITKSTDITSVEVLSSTELTESTVIKESTGLTSVGVLRSTGLIDRTVITESKGLTSVGVLSSTGSQTAHLSSVIIESRGPKHHMRNRQRKPHRQLCPLSNRRQKMPSSMIHRLYRHYRLHNRRQKHMPRRSMVYILQRPHRLHIKCLRSWAGLPGCTLHRVHIVGMSPGFIK